MASAQIVNLDIGGIIFRTTYSTLTRVPDSTLATYLQRWTEDGKEIFIDRSGDTFKYILSYLRDGDTGILPKDMSVQEELKREAQFYKLPRLVQLLDKRMSGDGGCRQVQQGSGGSSGGNVIERVEEAANSFGVNQPVQNQSKQEQNGDLLVPKDENEMPICTNTVCVWQGKCGVLQHSDQHMTDVWMCPQCYCTIALPQQQTAVVDDSGTVSKAPEQQKKVIAPVKATHRNPQSLGPGPPKPVVNMSGRKKPTGQCGKKPTQQAHKKHTTAPAKTNGGSIERVHKCKKCARCYGKESMLMNHMKRKHTVSPHKCNTCDQCFCNARELKQHLNAVHRGLKPFRCNQCGKSFSQKGNLNRHIKEIHGARNMECEACGQQFSRRDVLMQHELVHSGEKAFVCDTCGSRFTQASGLAIHRRLQHPQMTSHQCPACHMNFDTFSNMKQHLRHAHPIDMQ